MNALNREELKKWWTAEETAAFQGWDFSYLAGRMEEQELPWDYKASVQARMKGAPVMLDMGTGGGEFLLSLSPPPGTTYAAEGYPPNYELCQLKLPPHGIKVKLVTDDEALPFEDDFFDLVINRHESFSVREVWRILRPGGVFITQQVGGMNNRELSRFLLSEQAMITAADFHLGHAAGELEAVGFEVLERHECFPELRFKDIGALVYFAKIIEWEFSGFSVERCFERLLELNETVKRNGCVISKEHRFFIVAQKPFTR